MPITPRKADALANAYPARAVVAFSGHTELFWLHVLKPGYRHCFALVELEGEGECGWVLYNPLSVGTQLALWPGVEPSVLCDWLNAQGYEAMDVRVNPVRTHLFGWRPYTCVEAVKRVLGLCAPGVWTPWQLRQYLKKNK